MDSVVQESGYEFGERVLSGVVFRSDSAQDGSVLHKAVDYFEVSSRIFR